MMTHKIIIVSLYHSITNNLQGLCSAFLNMVGKSVLADQQLWGHRNDKINWTKEHL